jgi:hypothetical protein
VLLSWVRRPASPVLKVSGGPKRLKNTVSSRQVSHISGLSAEKGAAPSANGCRGMTAPSTKAPKPGRTGRRGHRPRQGAGNVGINRRAPNLVPTAMA